MPDDAPDTSAPPQPEAAPGENVAFSLEPPGGVSAITSALTGAQNEQTSRLVQIAQLLQRASDSNGENYTRILSALGQILDQQDQLAGGLANLEGRVKNLLNK